MSVSDLTVFRSRTDTPVGAYQIKLRYSGAKRCNTEKSLAKFIRMETEMPDSMSIRIVLDEAYYERNEECVFFTIYVAISDEADFGQWLDDLLSSNKSSGFELISFA
jgi:hypothetical protein